MRRFYFLILLLVPSFLLAQSLENLAKLTPQYVKQTNLSDLNNHQLFVATPFAKPIILNPEQKKILQEKVVIKIELVYTKYRKSLTFNQEKLNLNRLKELQKIAPFLFEFPLWEFELLSQTNGNSPEECNEMMHGFIITYRPNSSNETLKIESKYLQDLVKTMLKNDSLQADTTPLSFDIKTHYDLNIGYVHDTIWYVDTATGPAYPDFFYNHDLYKDSTVINAFERNKTWNNFTVVTDVTGSMSPYSAQVFVWLQAQAENKKANYFVFFNDGDNKASRKKKPLDTKGIYVCPNTSIDTVMQTAVKCMNNGSGGGEHMENDIEAIIEGVKYYPKSEGIILVADNMEIMRDYDYIKKIKTPVHVILCGTNGRINIQYLDLARQTKGSLHTSRSDTYNLELIKENEHFLLDEQEYTYKNGRFHSVYRLSDIYK